MAQSGDTGSVMYAGIAIILLIAIGALALFKFNLFNASDWLAAEGDDGGRTTIPRNPSDDNGGVKIIPPDGIEWDPQMPDAARYAVSHDRPLPERLTYTKNTGSYSVDIELRLVPQGWFIMGENDGVRSNMPKRWIWLDDYYISTDEFTNDQFYGFILADGYRNASYWTQEGFEYISSQGGVRGSPYVGWTALDRNRRLWALASPRDALTLEVLEDGLQFGARDVKVLALPDNGGWANYLTYDRGAGTVRLRYREDWTDINGRDLPTYPDHDLAKEGYLLTTGDDGRVDISGLSNNTRYTIIAWADGDTSQPLFGEIRRSKASYLKGPKMPVTGVSWFEADACCRYFEGTLPTEAQWEKAGRGANGQLFPWGNELEMNSPLPNGRMTTLRANLNRLRVEETGSIPDGASPYGVRDLVGNVSEWCRDVYAETPTWSEKNPFNKGGAKERRSERGSSTHDDDTQTAKLHNRRSSDPYTRGVQTRGFRITLDAETALKLTGWK
ncbi:MAG: formylglycine-generating enzyme family protein [Planctomycetes bacterium]|nr:formylglycine-generating enzyme family protein [Planctomycetota bacterium]